MASTWEEAFARLDAAVGGGDIVAKCVVDQEYAAIQHEKESYDHPGGGGMDYLGGPLRERATEELAKVSTHFLTATGSNLRFGMSRWADRMVEYVNENAPRLDHILRESGAPSVIDEGEVVYHRPPRHERVRKTGMGAQRGSRGRRR